MHMACPAASVVVVGVDDSAISYAFDALIENEDGERACIVPNQPPSGCMDSRTVCVQLQTQVSYAPTDRRAALRCSWSYPMSDRVTTKPFEGPAPAH